MNETNFSKDTIKVNETNGGKLKIIEGIRIVIWFKWKFNNSSKPSVLKRKLVKCVPYFNLVPVEMIIKEPPVKKLMVKLNSQQINEPRFNKQYVVCCFKYSFEMTINKYLNWSAYF